MHFYENYQINVLAHAQSERQPNLKRRKYDKKNHVARADDGTPILTRRTEKY